VVALAACVAPAVPLQIPPVAHGVRLIVVEEAPGPTVVEHVVGQCLVNVRSVAVVATPCLFGAFLFAIHGKRITVAQHHRFRQVRNKGRAKLRLAKLFLMLLCHFLFFGMLLSASSSLLVAHVVLVPVPRHLVWKLKVPDAPRATMAEHLVRQGALQEWSCGFLTAFRTLGEVILKGSQVSTAVVTHDVVGETTTHAILAHWLILLLSELHCSGLQGTEAQARKREPPLHCLLHSDAARLPQK